MKKAIAIIILIAAAATTKAIAKEAAQFWKYYPAYNGIQKIDSVSEACIYVLSSGNLYSVNKSEWSVDTYTRLTGLTDTDITDIKWNQQTKQLLIIYSNANIDMLDQKGNVTNIPDIFMKQTTLEKKLNHIFMKGEYAYLSMAFGIAKLNMRKAEISDTYILNRNIIQTTINQNTIYAKTAEGNILQASINDNLLDKASWNECKNDVSNLFIEKSASETLKNSIATLYPSGPRYSVMGSIKYQNDKLYIAEADTWDNLNYDCPQIYDISNDTWSFLHDDDNAIEEKTKVAYRNFYKVMPDPSNDNRIIAAGAGGVYEFLNGQFLNLHTDYNSPMTSAVKGISNFVLATAASYGKDGKLYVALSQATDNTPFLSMSKESNWQVLYDAKWIYNNISFGIAQKMITDSRGMLWWTNNHWWNPALNGYDPQSQTAFCYNTFYNEDNTKVEVTRVKAVAEDKEGNLWIGTDVGPLLMEKDNITKGGNQQWQQVKVPRNDGTNLADYLLAGISITSIKVDGANRKWFGTDGNGIYVIDSDNITQVQHFTSLNSMLLSDIILDMDIDNSKGEVYISTSKGLCSYRSDATAPATSMSDDSVYAYPNPVTPDYNGPITITGLTYDANVIITTTSGQVVAKGRSNGGNFTWYGKDLKGNKVASGVYMVCTATAEGEKGAVARIAIIR